MAEEFTLMARRGVADAGATEVFRVAPNDVARMRGFQAKVAAWGPNAGRGELALGLGGCAVGADPASSATAAAAIRLQVDGPFMPLIRETRLRVLLGGALFDAIAPCEIPPSGAL